MAPDPTRRLRILVTDAENRAALAVTRSLGRAGYHVAVAHHRHPTLASSSRYCRERIHVADPLQDPEGFRSGVTEAVRTHDLDAVMPVSDITTLTLARAVSDGQLDCRLCTPTFEQLDLAADKRRTVELAQNLRVPVPRTVVLESAGDAANGIPLPFPVVVKPARSRVWTGEKWLFSSIAYADSASRLEAILSELSPALFPVLLQERIEGPGIGVFACYDHGRLVTLFSHRRIREKPPSGGVSVLRESIPVDPHAGQQARALLEALKWHGPAMVEFKLDRQDNTLKLMEINGRLWGSLQLAIDAGVNFPQLMARIMADEVVTPVLSYQTGVRTRWFWGDADALLAQFLKPRESLNLPPDHPGRLRALLSFLIPWYPGLHYEILSLTDPAPWLHETRMWFSRVPG